MKRSRLIAIGATICLGASPLSAQRIVVPTARPEVPTQALPTEAAPGAASHTTTASAQPLSAPLQLRNGAVPTGLGGFYDYQSNGMIHGRLVVDKDDPQKLHTAYMLALTGDDSATVSTTRRVGYAYSNDGGATWQAAREIQPGFRLGFPYLAISGAGAPYIACHGDPDGQGTRTLVYTGTAGSTSFTRTGTFERLSFTGRDGDQGAGVIWPAMVISPKNAAKEVVVATLSPKSTPTREDDDPVHVAVADLGSTAQWQIVNDQSVSTSSGGRNVLAVSPAGKIGLAYYHASGNIGGTSGTYFAESTDGGNSWSDPVLALPAVNPLNDTDTLRVGGNLDMVYNGEEPIITTNGTVNYLYAQQGIYVWRPGSNAPVLAALTDTTKGLGLGRAVATKTQPSMDYVSYPNLVLGDDGRHVAVVFSAASQTDEGPFQSEDGFYYFRLWAVGSTDGGATWHDPVVIQDFVGETSDTASIEYPATAGVGTVVDGGMEFPITFQARSKPGMYAFIVSDISSDAGNQPADRGPFSETFQYFQKVRLDRTVFGLPAAVPAHDESAARIAINGTHPNPATGTVTVEYQIPRSGDVEISVYDMLGVKVMSTEGALGYAGRYSRTLNVASLSSGVYRVDIAQNGMHTSTQITVVR